jgi:hypothetical protein
MAIFYFEITRFCRVLLDNFERKQNATRHNLRNNLKKVADDLDARKGKNRRIVGGGLKEQYQVNSYRH